MTHTAGVTPRTLGALLCALVVLLAGCGTAPTRQAVDGAPPAAAPTAAKGANPAVRNPSNPLRGRAWATYRGPADQIYRYWRNADARTKKRLEPLLAQPKAHWFGAWIPDGQIAARVREHIAAAQGGNKNALVQATVYRLVPWQHEACRRVATRAERTSYRRWINRFARAVGRTPMAIVLQPDGPFALCAPGNGRVAKSLVRYAARKLSALPRTSVYLEVGASDWPAPGQGGVPQVLKFLLSEGIRDVRGVALNTTHYASTEAEIRRGTAIVRALSRRGIRGKKFVVNTSGNGHPFNFGTYDGADGRNPYICRSPRHHGTCVTLGIPPTTAVSRARWGLSATARRQAATYADAFLWFGRPWLRFQNKPFVLRRALDLMASTPYRDLLRR